MAHPILLAAHDRIRDFGAKGFNWRRLARDYARSAWRLGASESLTLRVLFRTINCGARDTISIGTTIARRFTSSASLTQGAHRLVVASWKAITFSSFHVFTDLLRIDAEGNVGFVTTHRIEGNPATGSDLAA